MITFESATKEFKLDAETKVVPVEDVSLAIARGEFIIIIGRSGSGKTTLLNLAAGLVKPTSGRVLMDGSDLAGKSEKQLSDLRSHNIGFVFQFPSLLSSLTVLENVSLPGIFVSTDKKEANQRAKELLKTLGLSSKEEVLPRQLSAGEQKRVVIARAMLNRPDLILADEPTSDLDEQTESEVMEILKDINRQGVTFLMVTHSLQLLPYATRAFRMDAGKLIEVARPG